MMENTQNSGLPLLIEKQARQLKKLEEMVTALKIDIKALSAIASMYLDESKAWERDTDYLKILTEPRNSWGKA